MSTRTVLRWRTRGGGAFGVRHFYVPGESRAVCGSRLPARIDEHEPQEGGDVQCNECLNKRSFKEDEEDE